MVGVLVPHTCQVRAPGPGVQTAPALLRRTCGELCDSPSADCPSTFGLPACLGHVLVDALGFQLEFIVPFPQVHEENHF